MRTRRRGNGGRSSRRRQEQRRAMRRRLLTALGIAALALLVMAPETRQALGRLIGSAAHAVQTAKQEQSARIEIKLKEMDVYALQLGAFDNGERAQGEMSRLQGQGIPCVLWQREQMRLVCDAKRSKSALSLESARGLDAWIIRETLEGVTLRITTDPAGIEGVRELLTMPDVLFEALCRDEAVLSEIVEQICPAAQAALGAYPENALYTQLAQSLVNWCTLMDSAQSVYGDTEASAYARVTMCMLCYELRQALNQMDQSAASMASAQRTPSTAADVMPPA